MSSPTRTHATLPPLGRLRFDAAAPAPRSDALLLAIAAFAVYWLLRQRAVYGLDVPDFINWLQMGKASHHIHYLFMPLMDALHRALHRLGSTPYQTLVFASCLGGSLAVFCLHRAGAALGMRRADAAMAVALAAAAPAVVFFATIAEIHAVFYAFFGAACWQWARVQTRPTVAGVVVLGGCTALAAAVHATGHLLAWLLPMLTVGVRGRFDRGWHRLLLAFLLAHAGASFGLDAWLRRATVDVQREGLVGFILQCIAQLPLGWNIAGDLWREWLWPFLPLSVVPIVGLFGRATRRFALAWCVAASAFLVMTVILLFGKLVERGAYQLPLAWPAAVLLLALAPRALQVAALLLGSTLSVAAVFAHDHPYENPDVVADLAAAAQHRQLFVVCADMPEYEPLLRDLPAVPCAPLFWLGQLVAQGYDAFVARFDEVVGRQLDAGRAVVFTTRAFQLLSTLPEPTIARLMHEHLPAHYETVPFRAGSFDGVELRKRK